MKDENIRDFLNNLHFDVHDSPIDCWDNCNCSVCKEYRISIIKENERILAWLVINNYISIK